MYGSLPRPRWSCTSPPSTGNGRCSQPDQKNQTKSRKNQTNVGEIRLEVEEIRPEVGEIRPEVGEIRLELGNQIRNRKKQTRIMKSD